MLAHSTDNWPTFLGANDACLPPSPQEIPLDKFISNLEWMVQALRSPSSDYYSPWTRIILFTPPPVQVVTRGRVLAERDPPRENDRDFDHSKKYAEATKELAARLKVPVVDAWESIWKAAGEKEEGLTPFLSDGLHLTDEGYGVSG
jgi:isoamyl acetate esterase